MQISDFRILVSTYSGLEEVLRLELLRLGARDLKILPSSVSCVGDLGFVYKANFCLRTAIKILIQVKSFHIESNDDLYNKVIDCDWKSYLDSILSFSVKGQVYSDMYSDNLTPEIKIGEAISEYYQKNSGITLQPVEENPQIDIYFIIDGNKCRIWLNTSGDDLYYRGYNSTSQKDYLNPVLAAGMIMLSGWEPQKPFVDFICTNGIFPVEAALYAAKIPPGVFREKYAFEQWKNFNSELYNLIRDKQLAHISENKISVYANSPDEKTKSIVHKHIVNAGVEDMISLTAGAFNLVKRPEINGTVILEVFPDSIDELEQENLFRDIGDYLKSNFSGYKAWIFTGINESVKAIGLIPNDKLQINDALNEFRFFGYDLFRKKKKAE